MKIRLITLVAFAAVMLVTLSSCKREKTPTGGEPTPGQQVLAQIKFGGTINEELAAYYVIAAEYELTYGNTSKKSNTIIPEGRVFSDIPCPCTLDLKLTFRKKTSVDPNTTYDIHFSTYVEVNTPAGNYSVEPKNYFLGVEGAHLAEIVEGQNNVQPTYHITIDQYGNIKAVEN